MSGVDFLEKLLDGVAVEWRALSTVIKTVTAPSKLKSQAYRATGRLPIVDQGIEFIAGYTDEDITPVEAGKYIIFGDHSEHIKYVDFSFVQGADGLKILKPIFANPKYIYYAFLNFYTKELSYKRHWSTAQQTLIPIPCPDNLKKSLEIQDEIVRILDAFTELTAELTAELIARKKQYNHYRDQLLSFEGGEVEWKTLGEIGTIFGGLTGKSKTDFTNGNARYVSYVNVFNNLAVDTKRNDFVKIESNERQRTLNHGDIIFTGSSETPEDVGMSSVVTDEIEEPIYLNSFCIGYRLTQKNILDPEFAKHLFRSEGLRKQIVQTASGVTRFNVSKLRLAKVKIPIIDLSEQKRIANILDKFDALTNSLTEGLPREIELRKKQYAHYRDFLLSFPKPDGEIA